MFIATLSDWTGMLDRISALNAKIEALEAKVEKYDKERHEQYDDLVQKIPTINEQGKLEAQVFGEGDGADFETVYLPFERAAS